jgi:translation elongation factor EF-G
VAPAFKNKGVQAMLDAVVELPAGSDRLIFRRYQRVFWTNGTPASVTLPMTSRSLLWHSRLLPTRSLANLTFFRVYSGVVNSGDTV